MKNLLKIQKIINADTARDPLQTVCVNKIYLTHLNYSVIIQHLWYIKNQFVLK